MNKSNYEEEVKLKVKELEMRSTKLTFQLFALDSSNPSSSRLEGIVEDIKRISEIWDEIDDVEVRRRLKKKYDCDE